MYKYQNISGMTQALNTYGIVEPEEIIEVDHAIENPNFKFLGSDNVVGTALPQPEAVTEAQLIDQPTNEETK